jgi:hypothetical protein|tara:strand:- start:396 stop:677 length:282 start_codon:yes stop_codon:yes gene_type:complete
MARITEKDIYRKLDALNELFGYKGRKWGKKKVTGKGFELGGAYGGVRIELYVGSSQVATFSGYETKKDAYEIASGMVKGVYAYKRRTKYKPSR